MKRYAPWLIGVVAIVTGLAFWLTGPDEPLRQGGLPGDSSVVPLQDDESAQQIQHPIPALPPGSGDEAVDATQEATELDQPADHEASVSLPPLSGSDPLMRSSLQDIYEPDAVERWFVMDNFVRRLVATVDNLPRPKLAVKHRPMPAVPGRFRVAEQQDVQIISPDNAARYTPYVKLFEALPDERLAELYTRYYPLFQEAYEELGYPAGYFNDRLVATIDHLLATPEVDGPIELVRPHVLYEYADPELEALSAGQKLLIRMGSDNGRRVRAKLRDIRARITRDGESAGIE